MKPILLIASIIGGIVMTTCLKTESYRKNVLLSLFLILFGSSLMYFSNSLFMACFGLFISGLNQVFIVRLGVPLISEVTQKGKAANFLSTLMAGSTTGSLLSAIAYGILKDWRHVALCF